MAGLNRANFVPLLCALLLSTVKAADVTVKWATMAIVKESVCTGDTVKWVWDDYRGHTVHGTGASAGMFTGNGGEFNVVSMKGFIYSYKFMKKGVYTFDCLLHPLSMTGTITVKDCGAAVKPPPVAKSFPPSKQPAPIAKSSPPPKQRTPIAKFSPPPKQRTPIAKSSPPPKLPARKSPPPKRPLPKSPPMKSTVPKVTRPKSPPKKLTLPKSPPPQKVRKIMITV